MTRESIMLSSGGSITARATVGPQYPHRSNFHVAAETSERECSSTSGTTMASYRLVSALSLQDGQGGTTSKSDPAEW